ncbi:MAG: sugar phosphate isomerase/epimerase family protein [Gemmatimonadota bacterium]|nr:sugar phosphate isomerase/epimerase family protein [Gemmatimonadota bacterium]
MSEGINRRAFLGQAVAAGAVLAAAPALSRPLAAQRAPWFTISLAQWSLHRSIRSGAVSHLDFAQVASQDFGITAIEYVNSFFKDKAQDAAYLADMNRRAADHGVYQHLIMCDGEGNLGDPDTAKRTTAVENHHRWVEAAKTLGCATIRVNAASQGSREEQARLAADGLRRLTEFAATHEINVIVENHGGLSSDGQWLSGVMRMVDHPRCGTLPDFGNFYEYDRYQGTADLMPFAKAVSAKTHDFTDDGEETTKDYVRLMRIVRDFGYRSWVGIEYEGNRLPEREGIARTKALLERVHDQLAS